MAETPSRGWYLSAIDHRLYVYGCVVDGIFTYIAGDVFREAKNKWFWRVMGIDTGFAETFEAAKLAVENLVGGAK